MQHISTLFVYITLNDRPEPNILLYRRPIGTDGKTGRVDPELAKLQRDQFRKQYGLD